MFIECFLCVVIVLYVLHVTSHLFLKPVKEKPISQMAWPRHREVAYLVQVHIAVKRQSWDLNSVRSLGTSYLTDAAGQSFLLRFWSKLRKISDHLWCSGLLSTWEQHHTFLDKLVKSHLFLQEKEELNRSFYKDFDVGRVYLKILHYWGLSSKYAYEFFTVRQGFGQVRSVFTESEERTRLG